ncbi:MAG TPA: MBL fold metallo-hydrolase [Caulobacteraceae bacterium]|nr:MBL fold metallo-hydrolase [Caulobacteraceae bacterium]
MTDTPLEDPAAEASDPVLAMDEALVTPLRAPVADDLAYPFAAPPAFGTSREVAPGVRWVRMPLASSLAAVNAWAIEDGDGWAIVDTGMGTPETIETWRRSLAEALDGRPVTRVLVTHMHPDHVGAAGWLTREFGCELWMSRLEFLMCRSMFSGWTDEGGDDRWSLYRGAGWTDQRLARFRGGARTSGFGRAMQPLPNSFRRMSDGQTIRIGGRDWKVVVGAGHSPEHACLMCEELGVFISGDQVLPEITSNVSVSPLEPLADPLEDWLSSLARIRGIVPDNLLVLPAHKLPFYRLHNRIDALIGHHDAALGRLKEELRRPRRAIDVFEALFNRRITEVTMMMATGESLAHLNYLVARGEAQASRDADGVIWYSAAAS